VIAGAAAVAGCHDSPIIPVTASASALVRPTDQPRSTQSQETTETPAAIRLWVLAGSPTDLRLLGIVDGIPRTVAVPVPNAWWASGDAERGFVLTVWSGGRLFTSDPVPESGQPAWRPLVLDPAAARRLDNPPEFAELSPDGRQVAAVAGDTVSGASDAQLAVIDRATGATAVVGLNGIADGRPPLWIGNGLVAVPLLDQTDVAEIAVVDLATGTVRHRKTHAGTLAISSDGRTVAYQPRGTGPLRIGSFEALLAGSSLLEASAEIGATSDDPRVTGQLRLDGSGSRLAATWLNDAGDITAVEVFGQRAGRWMLVSENQLPAGMTRVFVAGFGP
jgi:hypothetical protein